MKKFCLGLIVALVAVGCGGKEPITGIWKGTVNVPDEMKNDPTAKAQAPQLGTPVLEIKGDKTFTMSGGVPMTGTWEESETGLTLKMKTIMGMDVEALKAKAGGKAPPGADAIPVTISEDRKKLTLMATGANKGSIDFVR
jgi:hypothetical protein